MHWFVSGRFTALCLAIAARERSSPASRCRHHNHMTWRSTWWRHNVVVSGTVCRRRRHHSKLLAPVFVRSAAVGSGPGRHGPDDIPHGPCNIPRGDIPERVHIVQFAEVDKGQSRIIRRSHRRRRRCRRHSMDPLPAREAIYSRAFSARHTRFHVVHASVVTLPRTTAHFHETRARFPYSRARETRTTFGHVIVVSMAHVHLMCAACWLVVLARRAWSRAMPPRTALGHVTYRHGVH